MEDWDQNDDLEEMLLMGGDFDANGTNGEKKSLGENNSGCATMVILLILIISLFAMALW